MRTWVVCGVEASGAKEGEREMQGCTENPEGKHGLVKIETVFRVCSLW